MVFTFAGTHGGGFRNGSRLPIKMAAIRLTLAVQVLKTVFATMPAPQVHKRIFAWLTVDMLAFIAINAALIYRFGGSLARLDALRVFDFAVLALAAYRASNILSNEVVTKPLRAPFVDEVEKDGKIVEEPKPAGFLGATGLLIYCPSCTGVWLSAGLLWAYVFQPKTVFFIALFLAMSGVERIIAAMIGWFRRIN